MIGCSEVFSMPSSFKRPEGCRVPLEARPPGTLAWKGRALVIPLPPSQQSALQVRSGQQKRNHPSSCQGHFCLEGTPFFLLPAPARISYTKELFGGRRKSLTSRHLCQNLGKSPGCALWGSFNFVPLKNFWLPLGNIRFPSGNFPFWKSHA